MSTWASDIAAKNGAATDGAAGNRIGGNGAVEVHRAVGGTSVMVGTAFFTRNRGRVSTTFAYDTAYLVGGGSNIDPSLILVAGPQHVDTLLPAFSDSAPDRWGRRLVDKHERARARARAQGRTPRVLDDVDFLLGVSDATRQGDLRFRPAGSASYVGDHVEVPALISLPQLLDAAGHVDAEGDPKDAVKQLLDTGTGGLGGARPKASVRLSDGSLGIAKFPHSSDQWDVMAWEATALDLLERAGIRTPQRRLVKVGGSSVLVLRRFDRDASGDRIGYISAMTAVGLRDGINGDYVEVAGAMRDLSRGLRDDLAELFDRVVASVALGNTDDHLRNHGFLAAGSQWALSPAFDVNPSDNPQARRATSIAGADQVEHEVDGLLALAAKCDLNQVQARARMAAVAHTFAGWENVARNQGVSAPDIARVGASLAPRLERVRLAGE